MINEIKTAVKESGEINLMLSLQFNIGLDADLDLGIGVGINGGLTFGVDIVYSNFKWQLDLAIIAHASMEFSVGEAADIKLGSVYLCASGEFALKLVNNRIQGPGIGGWFEWNVITNLQFTCEASATAAAQIGVGVCATASAEAGIGTQASVGVSGCVGICFGAGEQATAAIGCGFKLQITASPGQAIATERICVYGKNLARTAGSLIIFDQSNWNCAWRQGVCTAQPGRLCVACATGTNFIRGKWLNNPTDSWWLCSYTEDI